MGVLTRQVDRRRSLRTALDQFGVITKVQINSETVQVIDISSGGLLMDCVAWLRVGRAIRLKVVEIETARWLAAHVVRCEVSVVSKSSVRYRVAVAFEAPLAPADESKRGAWVPPGAMPVADPSEYVNSAFASALALNSW